MGKLLRIGAILVASTVAFWQPAIAADRVVIVAGHHHHHHYRHHHYHHYYRH